MFVDTTNAPKCRWLFWLRKRLEAIITDIDTISSKGIDTNHRWWWHGGWGGPTWSLQFYQIRFDECYNLKVRLWMGIDFVFVASVNLGLIVDEGPKLGSLTIPSVVPVDTVAWDISIQWAGTMRTPSFLFTCIKKSRRHYIIIFKCLQVSAVVNTQKFLWLVDNHSHLLHKRRILFKYY